MSFLSPPWDIYVRHQTLSMDWFLRLQDMLEVSIACRSLKSRAFPMWCATRMSLSINMNIKPVYHHHMTFYGWRAIFGDLLHGHSPETTLEIGKNMEKCPRCMVHTAVCPMKVASSHFLDCIWGGAPSCWKLKLPSAFQAVRAFRTLCQEALKTTVNRFTARLRDGNVIPATRCVRRAQPCVRENSAHFEHGLWACK